MAGSKLVGPLLGSVIRPGRPEAQHCRCARYFVERPLNALQNRRDEYYIERQRVVLLAPDQLLLLKTELAARFLDDYRVQLGELLR